MYLYYFGTVNISNNTYVKYRSRAEAMYKTSTCLNGVVIDVRVIFICWNDVDVSLFYYLGQKFAFISVTKALINYFL